MKKAVLINTVLYGSTGTIVKQLRKTAEANGMEAYTVTAYARNDTEVRDDHDLVIGSFVDRYMHILLSRITGYPGFFSYFATKKLVAKLRQIKPDIIHLHNLHNAYINLPILFNYLRTDRIETIWTLHDCWAFTGRCPHFEYYECNKWKEGCNKCPYPKNDYPISYRDTSKQMWKKKKHLFTSVENLTLVTPSKWLANIVKESFLRSYPIYVINNGIDTSVIQERESNIRGKLGIPQDKILILGVSFSWGLKKGLDVFVNLAENLDDRYSIVLVGTDEKIDQNLPDRIISIPRTSNMDELTELYTVADVFLNPTREEVLGLVNIEAMACGTPVITFDSGGSPECIDNACGIIVDSNIDTANLIKAIDSVVEKKYDKHACRERAMKFDSKVKYQEYLELYSKALERK